MSGLLTFCVQASLCNLLREFSQPMLDKLGKNFNCETSTGVSFKSHLFKNYKRKGPPTPAELAPCFLETIETHFSCADHSPGSVCLHTVVSRHERRADFREPRLAAFTVCPGWHSAQLGAVLLQTGTRTHQGLAARRKW